MTVMLNGETRTLSRAMTVSDIVSELHLVPETLLIEHNGCALNRREWSERTLREADQIDFFCVAAGG